MKSDPQKSEVHEATEDAALPPARDAPPGDARREKVEGLSPERPAEQAAPPGAEILRDDSDSGGPLHMRTKPPE